MCLWRIKAKREKKYIKSVEMLVEDAHMTNAFAPLVSAHTLPQSAEVHQSSDHKTQRRILVACSRSIRSYVRPCMGMHSTAVHMFRVQCAERDGNAAPEIRP